MIDIVEARPADYEPLADFLAGFEGETRPRQFWLDRFALWWDSNPALSRDTPRGWLIKDNERVVGFLGGIPVRYRLRGESRVICSATTWRVHPDFRLGSLQLILRQMEAWKTSLLFFSTPSDKVREILVRLSFSAQSASVSGRTGVVINHRLGNPVLSLFLRRSAHKHVRELEQADASFDALWERTRDRHPTTCVRDARFINWFCFAGPAALRKQLFAFYEGEKLVGYTIFFKRAGAERSVFEQLDLWIEPDAGPRHDAIATALLAKAREHARKQRYRFLALRHFTEAYRSLLQRRGVLLFKRENWRHYYQGEAAPLAPEAAFFTCLEGDFAL